MLILLLSVYSLIAASEIVDTSINVASDSLENKIVSVKTDSSGNSSIVQRIDSASYNESSYGGNYSRSYMDRGIPLSGTSTTTREILDDHPTVLNNDSLNVPDIVSGEDSLKSKEHQPRIASSPLKHGSDSILTQDLKKPTNDKIKKSDKVLISVGTGVVIGGTVAAILVNLLNRDREKRNNDQEIPDPPSPPDY
jgi:hypothetical protein